MKQRHFTKGLALLIAVLLIAAVVPTIRIEAGTPPVGTWVGGNSSHTHSEVSRSYYDNGDGSTHQIWAFCDSSCGASQYLGDEAHTWQKVYDISPGGPTFPDGGEHQKCSKCTAERDVAKTQDTPAKSSEEKYRFKVVIVFPAEYKSLCPAGTAYMVKPGDTYYFRAAVVPGFTASPAYVMADMPANAVTRVITYTLTDPSKLPAEYQNKAEPEQSPAPNQITIKLGDESYTVSDMSAEDLAAAGVTVTENADGSKDYEKDGEKVTVGADGQITQTSEQAAAPEQPEQAAAPEQPAAPESSAAPATETVVETKPEESAPQEQKILVGDKTYSIKPAGESEEGSGCKC